MVSFIRLSPRFLILARRLWAVLVFDGLAAVAPSDAGHVLPLIAQPLSRCCFGIALVVVVTPPTKYKLPRITGVGGHAKLDGAGRSGDPAAATSAMAVTNGVTISVRRSLASILARLSSIRPGGGLNRAGADPGLFLVCGACADCADAELERKIVTCIRPDATDATAPAEEEAPTSAPAAAASKSHTDAPLMAAARQAPATWVAAAARAWAHAGGSAGTGGSTRSIRTGCLTNSPSMASSARSPPP